MAIPDIEKESTKTCLGCGEILLPHVVICNICKTVNKTKERGTWSNYSTLENGEEIVIKDISAVRKLEETKIVADSRKKVIAEDPAIDQLTSREHYRFDLLRKGGAILFLLVLIFSLFFGAIGFLQ